MPIATTGDSEFTGLPASARKRAKCCAGLRTSARHTSPGCLVAPGPWSIHVGRNTYTVARKLSREEFAARLNQSRDYAVSFGRVGERTYWLFQNRWFSDNENLTAAEVHAVLVTRDQRNQQRINRAQSMVAASSPTPSRRGAIPDDVKQYVWTRDHARCAGCNTTTELQFDHIIPVAYGGSSAAENLQILCGPCNRAKGASVI